MKTKLAAIFLIYSGIMLFVYGLHLVRQRYLPVDLSRKVANAQIPINSSYPIGLAIPALKLTLPIQPANIKNGKWDNPERSVGYWLESPLPGTKGNSVFYGHNWPAVFGELKNVQVDDEITIAFENGVSKTFEVKSKNTITPDQTHILDQTSDTRITLYTCTGFLDFKRLVVVAVLKK